MMTGRVAPLADHRVHGMGLALEAPTWPAITIEEAAAAIARFPAAGRLIRLHWHSPRPFSAAVLSETTQGAFFLKRHHHTLRSVAGLAEEHAFIAHLAARGIAVPDVLTTADGAGAVAIGDWRYELHRVADGADLYRDRMSWTPFLRDDHAFAAGIALARLHVAARDFSAPRRRPQPLVASFTILPARDPLAAFEAYVAARPALAAFLTGRAWRDEVARLFRAAGTGVSAMLADQPPLWTHNDWHPSNLLWAPDGTVSTVFDFGLSDRSCAVHDIATAIERTTIRWLDLGRGDDTIGDAASAQRLLAGYTSVVPLSDAERRGIVRLLPLVHIEFAASEVAYFSGIVGDAAAACMAWDDYLIGHADWFLSPPGQTFLARLDRQS